MHDLQVKEAISESIDELNSQLAADHKITNEPSALLYGMNSKLDSLDLVTLIVDIEHRIEDKTGIKIVLANDRALSMKHTPFRSVQTLTDYSLDLVREKTKHG